MVPVRASILANLPLTLRRLDVQERGALQDTLRNAERAQRKREQAVGPELQDAADTERKEAGAAGVADRKNPSTALS